MKIDLLHSSLSKLSQPGLNFSEKRELLMHAVLHSIDADYWVWGLATGFKTKQIPQFSYDSRGGFSSEGFKKFLIALHHDDMKELATPLITRLLEKWEFFVSHSYEYDPEQNIWKSEVGKLWKELNLGDTISAFYPISQNDVSVVGIYRGFNKKPFSEEDRDFVKSVLALFPWLHNSGWQRIPIKQLQTLSPRQRVTLNLLLDGLTRKEISLQLNISEHTVNDYVKQIFKKFSISSQPQLMVLFRHGIEHP